MSCPQPHILMCSPDFYGIHYEINPWMDLSRQAEHAVAVEQWQALHQYILDAGAKVSLITPVEGLPDLVFTANAAMMFREQALLSRFRHRQRQGEEPYNRAWLTEHGFTVVDVPEHFSFEGAGDALFCGDTLYAGYRMRSDANGHQQIGRLIGCRVIPVELVDARYYHLDTCFCPLSTQEAIWYPPAFDEYGQRAIRTHVGQSLRDCQTRVSERRDHSEPLIEVEREEAERFACNAVVIGKRVITNTGCDKLHTALAARGFEPVATPLDEFVKAGGSAKCLTLRLDGEEAAAWRETGEAN